jgi:hypothetical protein
MNKLFSSLLALSALSATVMVSHQADACGGCFIPVSENTVVTGHRMALSISKTQAVLWDQIQSTGDPAEFSCVLPIKKGAFVEVANDAFFDVLETGTVTSVQSPPEGCTPQGGGSSGFGCSSSDSALLSSEGGGRDAGNGVTVVHEGTVGPYETVTLSAENPNALAEWLEDNGYDLPDNIRPTVDAYVEEDFDFIALKLQPNQGVASMKPVRVITPGSGYTLPLRMVAAGVGESVDIVLYVIGEGRYEAADFENPTIDPKLITWDYKVDRSDYAEQRLGVLEAKDGRNFLTSYSRKNAIMGELSDPSSPFGGFINYNIGDGSQSASNMAAAYVLQGFENGEEDTEDSQTCISNLQQVRGSDVVTNLCDAEGNCETAGAGEVDSRLLTCGSLDDLAVAMDGMHPDDVVVTRLEAKLPVAALDTDLRLEAGSDQAEVESRFTAGLKVNPCWDQPSVAPLTNGKPQNRIPPEGLALLVLGAAGISLAMRRRVVRVQA